MGQRLAAQLAPLPDGEVGVLHRQFRQLGRSILAEGDVEQR